jgi:hypothetical protein
MIFDLLNRQYFLVSFATGLLIVYTNTPPPEIIIKYPTPSNAGKIIYKDDAGVCYKYKASEVKCPENGEKVETQPLQHIEEDEKPKTLFQSLTHLYNNN